MIKSHILHVSLRFFLISVTTTGLAEVKNPPLPDPITLKSALSLLDEPHPSIEIKEHSLNQAELEKELVESNTDFDLRLDTQARYIDPPKIMRPYGREDHRAVIEAQKVLYDFGRTESSVSAANKNVQIAQLTLSKAKQLRKIDIMQGFFAVVLADLQYEYDNESMAIYYVTYDRAKQKQKLGQLSDIEVLRDQSEYMEVRRNRFRSEAAQRIRRVEFSILLNRPEQIISHFIQPKLDYAKYQLIDAEKLQTQAVANNLDLKILRKKRQQLKEEIQSIHAKRYPILTATAEAGLYSRGIGNNDAWRLGVGLEVPIYQGDRVSKAEAIKNEMVSQLNLEIYSKEQEIKSEVLSLVMDIGALKKQLESARVGMDYRDVGLDKARSLYQMEFKTDLGDSMVAMTGATKYQTETEFDIALKWEQLRYLTQMQLENMHQ